MGRQFRINGLVLGLACLVISTSVNSEEKPLRTLEETQQFIRNHNLNWVAGETSVSHLSWEEFQDIYLHPIESDDEWDRMPKVTIDYLEEIADQRVGVEVDTSAEKFSWINHNGRNWMTVAKDQGMCGSCGVFAAIGATECAYNIALNNPDLDFNFSEQFVLACSAASCWFGTTVQQPCYYLDEVGVPDDECMPYIQREGQCANACPDHTERLFKIKDVQGAMPSDEGIRQILAVGPAFCAIEATSGLQRYTSGVFDDPTANGQPNHAISIVGWDDTVDAWWIRNSWGTGWGIDGFGMVKRGCCSVGWTATTFVADTETMSAAICPNPATLKIYKSLKNSGNASGIVKLETCAGRPGQMNFTLSKAEGQVGTAISYSTAQGTVSKENPVNLEVTVASSSFTTEGVFEGGGIMLKNRLQDTFIPVIVEVSNEDPPEANFSADPVAGQPPLKVNFENRSTGGETALFTWDFGDGNDSEDENPSHKYAEEGTYSVTLTVSGPGGQDVKSKKDYILVTTDEEEITEHQDEVSEQEEDEFAEDAGDESQGGCGCSVADNERMDFLRTAGLVIRSLF